MVQSRHHQELHSISLGSNCWSPHFRWFPWPQLTACTNSFTSGCLSACWRYMISPIILTWNVTWFLICSCRSRWALWKRSSSILLCNWFCHSLWHRPRWLVPAANQCLLSSLPRACAQGTYQDIPYWHQRPDFWLTHQASGAKYLSTSLSLHVWQVTYPKQPKWEGVLQNSGTLVLTYGTYLPAPRHIIVTTFQLVTVGLLTFHYVILIFHIIIYFRISVMLVLGLVTPILILLKSLWILSKSLQILSK